MSKSWHLPYSEEFEARMVELVRAGRTPAELAEGVEPSAESIRQWSRQADRDEGKRSESCIDMWPTVAGQGQDLDVCR